MNIEYQLQHPASETALAAVTIEPHPAGGCTVQPWPYGGWTGPRGEYYGAAAQPFWSPSVESARAAAGDLADAWLDQARADARGGRTRLAVSRFEVLVFDHG